MTAPPRAAKRPHSFTYHGRTVEDPYHWLRDPGYPEVTDTDVLAHLEAENGWYQQHMAAQQPLVDSLFAEMKARIKEADTSVPQKDGAFIYWTEFVEGAQYIKHWRKPVSGGEDQLILDENELAEGKDYFRLYAFSVSPCGRYLAYSVDENGSERFTVQIKDLESGEMLPDRIEGTLSSLVWSANSTMLLYAPVNANWRTDRAMLHVIGSNASEDKQLFHESDEGFRVDVSLSATEKLIFIDTSDHETSETWFVPADDPLAEPQVVRKRETRVEYSVDDYFDGEGLEGEHRLIVLTNDSHINFRVASAAVATPGDWQEIIAGSDDVYITGVETFAGFFVVESREAGLDQIELRRYADPSAATRIAFPEASYSAGTGNNPEYAMDTVRVGYSSMVSPATVFDYDVADGTLETLKVQEIPSGYDADQYVTERLMIDARDGTPVPVSLVRHIDTPVDGSAPLHLYGYGAYGLSIDPSFSTTRLSLVDRGFIYAIAHIRGGDDLGRQWYLDGKLEKRTNTFTDFIDVAEGLIARGYTAKGLVTASGGSAGGELMGAIVNMAPELFGAVVAHVPFVDVLSTMLDASLPLTAGEWPEWGNPIEDEAAFDLIRSYSPYDQVAAHDYPPMFVTAGLNDPRVTYWEPAKWVAKLREVKTDDNLLLLKTNMGAGHGGKSGRWESLKETAEEFAFILWVMGRAQGTSQS